MNENSWNNWYNKKLGNSKKNKTFSQNNFIGGNSFNKNKNKNNRKSKWNTKSNNMYNKNKNKKKKWNSNHMYNTNTNNQKNTKWNLNSNYNTKMNHKKTKWNTKVIYNKTNAIMNNNKKINYNNLNKISHNESLLSLKMKGFTTFGDTNILPQKRKFSEFEATNPSVNLIKHGQPNKKIKIEEKIIGESSMIERDYIRNVSALHLIRPPDVLVKSLENLKKKFIHKTVNYEWVCNQFKSIRQDLRIQNIENDFTVRVYESHARIALQNYDLNEFNQCLSILFHLYTKENSGITLLQNKNEFVGYKILYLTFIKNDKELQDFLKKVYEASLEDKSIIESRNFSHAITTNSYFTMNNYFRVFNYLYNIAPKMSKTLISIFKKRDFLKYVGIICKSHINTTLPISYFVTVLNVDGGEKEVIEWLKKGEIIFDEEKNIVNCTNVYKQLIKRLK